MDAGFGSSLAGDGVALIAVLAVTGAFILTRRMLRRLGGSSARRRIADLEARLNEAETAIAAEHQRREHAAGGAHPHGPPGHAGPAEPVAEPAPGDAAQSAGHPDDHEGRRAHGGRPAGSGR